MTKHDNLKFTISNNPPPDHEIWIAEDVVIHCRSKAKWWNKLLIKSFFGWRVVKK